MPMVNRIDQEGYQNYTATLDPLLPDEGAEIRRLTAINRYLEWHSQGLVHEAKGRLAAVAGSVALLATGDLRPNDIRELSQTAKIGVLNTLEILTNYPQLLKERIDLAEHLKTEQIDLIPLISTVAGDNIALRKGQKEYRSLQLIFEPNAKQVIATADPVFMKAIVHNLSTNAIEAMKNRRIQNLRIYCEQRENGLVPGVNIYFEDTGKGIPITQQNLIFREGFTTKPDGNGIGLPDVRQLLAVQRGSIDLVRSGRTGTTFVVFLPYQ